MAKRNLSGSYEDETVTIIGNDPSQTQVTWRTNPCLRHEKEIVETKEKFNGGWILFLAGVFMLGVVWWVKTL